MEQSKHIKRFKAVINRRKNPKWHERNYFFATTIFVVLFLIFNHAFGVRWDNLGGESQWYGFVNLDNFFRAFVNGFVHLNMQHALLNALCFFIVGIYLERKIGSLKFLALIFTMSIFSAAFIGVIAQRLNFRGFSGINFALYFYVIVDYIAYHIGRKRNKQDTIYGAIMMGLIYLIMCFNGGTTGFSFTWFPHDLLNNAAHYGGAIAGTAIALLIKIMILYGQRKKREDPPEKIEEKVEEGESTEEPDNETDKAD